MADLYRWLIRLFILAMVLLLPAVRSATAQEWTRFRGPNGSGIGQATSIPVSWTEEDYNWQVELPGEGHGSPVLWGDRLFINCADDEGELRIVQCRSATTGQLLWAREFPSRSHRKHKFNSFATSTPCVDEERVYVAWGTPEELTLLALSHTGELLWRADDLGRVQGGHGFGTSPILYENLVVIANDTEQESALLAVEKRTGELVWKIPRPGGRLNFSTPCVYSSERTGDLIIFVAWPIGVTAVDPKRGEIVWEQASFDQETGQRAIASPITHQGLVFANCAFVNNPKHLVTLRPGAEGAEEVFRVDNGTVPHIPSLLAWENRLYAWNDQGIGTCYEIPTGKQLWQRRIGGNYFSSPVCVDGKIYCINADGVCVVIAATDRFEELARNDLGETCRSTPAIANGRMYIRTMSRLVSLGGFQAK
jgi:outer membrane protein assembly factor BamB